MDRQGMMVFRGAAGLEALNRRGNHFVLMYHNVGGLDRFDAFQPFVVSQRAFRAQMDAIEARGLKPVTVRQVLAEDADGTTEEQRIVITFDDCSRGLLDFALPELENRGWKATFFAVAGMVGGYNDWDEMRGAPRIPLMGWEDLRQLSALGHEIGGHGFSHRSLRTCGYEAALQELLTSREVLQQGIGGAIVSMAYPFGEAPDGYPTLCTEAGFLGACSIFSMSRTVMADPFAIRRILVTNRDAGIRMRVKLSSLYLLARALVVDRDRLRVNVNRPKNYRPNAEGAGRSNNRATESGT